MNVQDCINLLREKQRGIGDLKPLNHEEEWVVEFIGNVTDTLSDLVNDPSSVSTLGGYSLGFLTASELSGEQTRSEIMEIERDSVVIRDNALAMLYSRRIKVRQSIISDHIGGLDPDIVEKLESEIMDTSKYIVPEINKQDKLVNTVILRDIVLYLLRKDAVIHEPESFARFLKGMDTIDDLESAQRLGVSSKFDIFTVMSEVKGSVIASFSTL